MFNDKSSPAALLATRRSGKPRDMVAPGPDDAQLRKILSTATRTPDHGKLFPWRFVVVGDDQRDKFAETLKQAYLKDKPDAGKLELNASDLFAHQGQKIIVVLSATKPESHIPVWEQQLSAGAVCMNILHAAHAEGFVGSWLTGWATYSDAVKQAFGGSENDQIAGFIFLGSPGKELDERPRPDYEMIVSNWS